MTEIHPFLAVRDVGQAVEFCERAFGAVEAGERTVVAGGRPVAVLTIAVRISLHVDDPDAVQARAVAAGATEMFPVADQPYGMRQGRVVDPSGHHWLIGRRL